MVKTKTYNKIRKLLSITLIAVMLIGIFSPVAAGIDLPTGSIVSRVFGVTEALAAESDVTTWTASGTCEWGIDSDGCLWIRPVNGVSGTLSNWGMNNPPWDSKLASIESVVIKPGVSAITCFCMFYNMTNCTSMALSGLDTSNVTRMDSMFNGCSSLTNLDLSGLETSKVTNMSGMFFNCSSLTSLDVSNFDTSNVTNMRSMFSDCYAITSLDVSEFDTSNVTSMYSMFSSCYKLTSLDLSGWDTSNVTDMSNMFRSCSKLWEIKLGVKFAFNGKNISSLSSKALLPTPPSSTTTGKWVLEDDELGTSAMTSAQMRDAGTVTPGTWVWEKLPIAILYSNGDLVFCEAYDPIDETKGPIVKTYDGFIKNAAAYNYDSVPWYSECSNIHEVYFNCPITPRGTAYWFYGCNNLTAIHNIENLNTSSATSMSCMFSNCSKLTSLDVSRFDTSNVTDMLDMFKGCEQLTSLDVSGWNTSMVEAYGMKNMFYGCKALTSLDLSSFDTSNVKNMEYMFRDCKALTSLDISGFDTSNVTNMQGMFQGSSLLNTIKLGENFAFNGKNISDYWIKALLPTPPSATTTGKWILEDDVDGGSAMTPAQMRDAGTVTAGTWVWQMKTNTAVVSFSGNGGTITGLTSFSQTDTFTPIAFPEAVRPEYMLTGWNTKADGTGTAYPAEGSITPVGGQNITLYAQWALDTRVSYLVKHYKQSAGVEPIFPNDYTLADTESLKAEPGTSVTPDVMTYPYFTVPETQTVEVASDGSTVVNYLYNYAITTINFYGNGNDSGMMRTQDYAWARGDKLNKNLFSKTGHIFTGWNTAADGSGVSFSDRGLVPNAPSNPLNLFAQWQEISVQTADDTTGLFTVTLHAGEYARISGLPAGSTYEIVEVNIPNGWQLTSEEGTTGKIVSNDIKEANFLNTYSASGEADIQAHKLLNNGILSSGQFSFGLRKVGESEPLQIKTNGAVDNNATIIDQDSGEELPNPNYGLGDITFDPIEYTAEGVYQYEIYEIAPSPGDPDYYIGVQYDTRVLPVTVTVSDVGGGRLAASVTYPNGDRFVNSILPGSLHLIEALVESYTTDIEGHPQPGELIRDDDHIFTVTVHFTDDAGNPVPGEFPVRYVDENGNTTNGTISDGDVINIHTFKDALITELPDGTHYSAVMRHDNGYEYYTAYEVEGTIVAGETKNGEFYIVPMPPEIVTTSITVKKTVRGNLSDVNKDFEFTLHLEDEQGNPYTGAVRFTGKEAGSEDLDGNGNMTFTLKHNEEISFIGLPVGIRYSVTERDYTTDGYQTSSTNDSGITTAAPIQVDFINTNSAMVPTGINLQMASGITLVALAMLGVGIYISKHKKSKKAEHTAE